MLTGKPSLINQMGYSQMFSSLGGGLLGLGQQDYLNQLAMQQQAAQQSPYWAPAQAAAMSQNSAPATTATDDRLLVLLTEE